MSEHCEICFSNQPEFECYLCRSNVCDICIHYHKKHHAYYCEECILINNILIKELTESSK